MKVNYNHYITHFMKNKELSKVFKLSYSSEAQLDCPCYHPNFLERFLIDLDRKFMDMSLLAKEQESHIKKLKQIIDKGNEMDANEIEDQQIFELRSKVEELNSEFKELRAINVELALKHRNLTKKYTEVEEDNRELQVRSNALETEFDKYDSERKKRDLQNQELKEKIRSLTGKNELKTGSILGVKLKVEKISKLLKKLSSKTHHYVEENKLLRKKIDIIELKNGLGYENLTPRPNYKEIFSKRNLSLTIENVSLKVSTQQITTVEIIEELINQIKLLETEKMEKMMFPTTTKHSKQKRSMFNNGGKFSDMIKLSNPRKGVSSRFIPSPNLIADYLSATSSKGRGNRRNSVKQINKKNQIMDISGSKRRQSSFKPRFDTNLLLPIKSHEKLEDLEENEYPEIENKSASISIKTELSNEEYNLLREIETNVNGMSKNLDQLVIN